MAISQKGKHPTQWFGKAISSWSHTEKMTVVILAVMIAFYIIFFSAYQIQRHASFETSLDTLSVEQPLWNTLHGHFMRSTYYPVTGETVTNFNDRKTESLLGDHVQLSLLFLLIPYAIVPKSETLFVVLSFFVALGAIPLYRITKRRLNSPWLALLFSAGYLLLPAVETNTGWDIHAACFLPPLLLAAIDAADTGNIRLWWVITLFAMGFKEDFPFFVGWAMIWMVPRHLRKQALALFGVGLLFALVSFFVIIPHFGGGGTPYIVRFFPLGTPITLQGVLSAIGQPSFWKFDLVNLITYNLRLGLPLLFLYFASAPAMLAMAPLILVNSLSWYEPTRYPNIYHYSAPLISLAIIGSIDGFRKITSSLKQRRPALTWYGIIGVALATSILTNHWILGYTPLSKGFIWPESTGRESTTNEFLNMIPKEADVSVEAHLGAHLAQYDTVRIFPDIRNVSWLLLDTWYGSYPYYLPLASTQAQWDAIRQDPSWETVAAHDGLILLKKGNGPPQNIADVYRINNPGLPEFSYQFGTEQRISLVDLNVIHHSRDKTTFCTEWKVVGTGTGLYPKIQFLSSDNNLTAAPEFGINLIQEILTRPGSYRFCRRMPSAYFNAQRTAYIFLEANDTPDTPVIIQDTGKWVPYVNIKNNKLEIDLSKVK